MQANRTSEEARYYFFHKSSWMMAFSGASLAYA
jgi:hypothetical protein